MDQPWELEAKIEALLLASDHAIPIRALARCLEFSEDETDDALHEFEADSMAADRGSQLLHRPHGASIETMRHLRESIFGLTISRNLSVVLDRDDRRVFPSFDFSVLRRRGRNPRCSPHGPGVGKGYRRCSR